jgi:hypothetical protein
LESSRVLFFPEKHDIVVLYFCEGRRHFGFVWRESSLTSGRGYVLGVNDIAGGFLGGVAETNRIFKNVLGRK